MNKCHFCYEEIPPNTNHTACIKNMFGSEEAPIISDFSHEFLMGAVHFLKKKVAVTGVQKKISLGYDTADQKRLTIIDALDGQFILKPPSDDFPQLPELEDLTMHLAHISGIEVAHHCLYPMPNNTWAYLTRRFDRAFDSKKIAQEDACQLSFLPTEKKYKGSHEKLVKTVRNYSAFPGDDALKVFEIVLFSFMTGNGDMHLKNFSLYKPENHYRLTPAYDLVPTRLLISKKDDPEELALNLNGKKSNFKLQDFMTFGENAGIPTKVIHNTINQLHKCKPALFDMINKSMTSDVMKHNYEALITRRLHRLV